MLAHVTIIHLVTCHVVYTPLFSPCSLYGAISYQVPIPCSELEYLTMLVSNVSNQETHNGPTYARPTYVRMLVRGRCVFVAYRRRLSRMGESAHWKLPQKAYHTFTVVSHEQFEAERLAALKAKRNHVRPFLADIGDTRDAWELARDVHADMENWKISRLLQCPQGRTLLCNLVRAFRTRYNP